MSDSLDSDVVNEGGDMPAQPGKALASEPASQPRASSEQDTLPAPPVAAISARESLTPSITTQESRPILRLEHVSVQFGRQPVLRDISLQIQRGQALAIIGESGCGKTVLLKVLVGLIRPTQGRVWFDGQDLHSLSEAELVRQRLRFAFVFQGAALFDSMNVYENVAFSLRQHTSLDEATIRQRVVQQLAEVGLTQEVLDKYPADLSGGMRKRVGLARAMILRPEIILFDEPTTGLDPIMADAINTLIRLTYERYQVTSVVVTHDLKTVHRVAQRVIMLYPLQRLGPEENQIIFDGTVAELEQTQDTRVRQFVLGQAGEYLLLSP